MNNNVNYIFDVVGEKGQSMRGFLDMETKQIVIYDDLQGKEVLRIGGQSKQPTRKKLTTLTFVICNGSDKKQTATLFGSNLEPLIQPMGVSVIIKEIENLVFNSHNYLRRDVLSNKLKIVGFSYFVQNTQQFNNDLQFGTLKPYGVVETIPFSPLNYLSKNQIDTKMMDMSKKFNWDVDARSVLYVPIEPKSQVTLLFNVIEDTNLPYINYKDNLNKKQIAFDGNYTNTIFRNINSGGLGAVNFDGSSEDNIDANNKDKELFYDVVKFGVALVGIGLVVNAISKMR